MALGIRLPSSANNCNNHTHHKPPGSYNLGTSRSVSCRFLYILPERALHITRRKVLTHKIPTRRTILTIAPCGATPYIGRRLPYHLREMPRFVIEFCTAEIVIFSFVAPELNGRSGVGIPGCKVLTEGNILGMSKIARLGVAAGGCGEGGVPAERGGVVGGAVGVVGFEKCGREDIGVGVGRGGGSSRGYGGSAI